MVFNISYEVNKKITNIWWTLKLTYGLLFVIAGADKFFNVIVVWEKFISPYLINILNLTALKISLGIGIIEILIGLTTLFISARIGAYLSATWLFLIVINLLTMYPVYLDIAVRDIVMAIGAIALGQLTDVKEIIDIKNNK